MAISAVRNLRYPINSSLQGQPQRNGTSAQQRNANPANGNKKTYYTTQNSKEELCKNAKKQTEAKIICKREKLPILTFNAKEEMYYIIYNNNVYDIQSIRFVGLHVFHSDFFLCCLQLFFHVGACFVLFNLASPTSCLSRQNLHVRYF